MTTENDNRETAWLEANDSGAAVDYGTFCAGWDARAALSSRPYPATDEAQMVALHEAGAFCGVCDYESAIYDERDDDGNVEWRCGDCEKTLAGYVAALNALAPRSTSVTDADERALYLAVERVVVDEFKVKGVGLSDRITDAVVAAIASRPSSTPTPATPKVNVDAQIPYAGTTPEYLVETPAADEEWVARFAIDEAMVALSLGSHGSAFSILRKEQDTRSSTPRPPSATADLKDAITKALTLLDGWAVNENNWEPLIEAEDILRAALEGQGQK